MGSRVNEGVTSSLAQTMILEWLGPIEIGLKHKDFVSVHNHNIFEGWANAAINMIKKVTEAWQLICRRRARHAETEETRRPDYPHIATTHESTRSLE